MVKTPEEKLKETQARIKRQIEHNIKRMREGDADLMDRQIGQSDKFLERNLGIDLTSKLVGKMVESIPVEASGKGYDLISESNGEFSFRNLMDFLYEREDAGKLQEGGAMSAYGSLIRLGATNLVSKAFNLVPLVWDKVVMIRPVNAFYMALGSSFRPTLPQTVGAGEEYPHFGVVPMGNLVEMLKWGGILEFQEEAIADDQTGELSTKSSEAGENMRIYQELSFAAYMSDTSLSEGNLTIAPLTYTDPDGSTGVFSSVTTGVQGYRQNLTTAGKIGMNTLKTARRVLKNMRDVNGIKMAVMPNTLLYTPDDEQDVDVLLKSPTWPSSTNQGSSTPGDSTGAVNATNPLAGYGYTPIECRYLYHAGNTNGGAWFLGQRQSRSLVYGNRSGLRTVMENPSAGQSFERSLQRWKMDQRGAFAWVLGGARFWYRGNTGL